MTLSDGATPNPPCLSIPYRRGRRRGVDHAGRFFDQHHGGDCLSNTQVGTFVDSDSGGTVGDYSGTIFWGDGNSSAASFTAGSGNFLVKGGNTYANPGVYTGVARVLDGGGAVILIPFSVTVAPTSPYAVSGIANDPDVTLLPFGEFLVSPNTGGVHISHALDFDNSPGTSVGGNPALVYNSDTVAPRPIIPVTVPVRRKRHPGDRHPHLGLWFGLPGHPKPRHLDRRRLGRHLCFGGAGGLGRHNGRYPPLAARKSKSIIPWATR